MPISASHSRIPALTGCWLLLLLMPGCFFEEPISQKPSHDIDPALLGTWVTDDDHIAKLAKKDQSHYSGSVKLPQAGGGQLLDFEAWHTVVEDIDFLTFKYAKPPDMDGDGKIRPYQFAVWKRVSPSEISVRLVKGARSEFTADTEGAMAERIKRHKNDPDLLADEQKYVKK